MFEPVLNSKSVAFLYMLRFINMAMARYCFGVPSENVDIQVVLAQVYNYLFVTFQWPRHKSGKTSKGKHESEFSFFYLFLCLLLSFFFISFPSHFFLTFSVSFLIYSHLSLILFDSFISLFFRSLFLFFYFRFFFSAFFPYLFLPLSVSSCFLDSSSFLPFSLIISLFLSKSLNQKIYDYYKVVKQ